MIEEQFKNVQNINYDYPVEYSEDMKIKKFYDENGYVSIKNGIPISNIHDIIDDLNQIFLPYATNKEYPIDSAIIELDKNDKVKLYELHQVACRLYSISKIGSSVSKYINAITGKRIHQFNISSAFLLSIPRDKRLVYDFHQESNFMRGFTDIFNIHYPLIRTSVVENGTMSILAGSHKLKTLDFKKSRKTSNSYTDLVPLDIDNIKKSYEERYNFLEVGDVLIFHKDTIHRSNFNYSNKARPVGINRLTTTPDGNWVSMNPENL